MRVRVGIDSSFVKQQFMDALQVLMTLLVWVVERLCINERVRGVVLESTC